jgi:hypothetical protein
MHTDALNQDYELCIAKVQSVRQEAVRVMYERALQAKDVYDKQGTPHTMEIGDWVLVWHETPQKFEAKWFGPYQIVIKMLLGTYGLQDLNRKKLAALVHRDQLLKIRISSVDQLRKAWAEPLNKDQL